MGGQGWAMGVPGSSGKKQRRNKRQNPSALANRTPPKKDIDSALRGQRQLQQRRISFVPAKRPQNGDIIASAGANGTMPQHVKKDAGASGKKGGRMEEEQFEEVAQPLYPRVRIRRVLEWKRVNKIGPGLHNLGNTCFCNAVLQCLTYTPPLANFCLEQSHSARLSNKTENSGKYDAMAAMERHVATALRTEKGAIRPTTIVNNLKKIGPRLKVGRQEDAHEFNRLLIECMHVADLGAYNFTASPYSRPAQTGVLHGIFGGHLRSQVHCETCKFNSNTYDAFLDLSLEIKKAATLHDAFRSFTKAEVLDGANKYKCSSCGCKTRATKSFSIHRLPHVLQIHLKRFETSWGGNSVKISRHIQFPMSLNVQEFVSKGEQDGSNGGNAGSYALYGVVVHSGHSVRSGHYYAYVKNSNGVWYEMDDDQVRSVSTSVVLKQQAYMLFYLQQPAGAASPAMKPKTGSSPLLQAQVSSAAGGRGSVSPRGVGAALASMPALNLAEAHRLAAPMNSNRDSEEEDEDDDDSSEVTEEGRGRRKRVGSLNEAVGGSVEDGSDEDSDDESYLPEDGSSSDEISKTGTSPDQSVTSEEEEGSVGDVDADIVARILQLQSQKEGVSGRSRGSKPQEDEGGRDRQRERGVQTATSLKKGARRGVGGMDTEKERDSSYVQGISVARHILMRGRAWMLPAFKLGSPRKPLASPTHVSPALTRRRAAARAASAEGVVKSLHFGQIKGCVGGGMARETSSEEDDEVEFRGAFRRGAKKAGSGAGEPDGTVEVAKGESGGKQVTGGGATGMSSSMLRQVMGLKAGQFQADVGQWDSEESLVLAKQQAQLLRTKEVRVERKRRDVWDEEYDKGRTKKVKYRKGWEAAEGETNPFQKEARVKASAPRNEGDTQKRKLLLKRASPTSSHFRGGKGGGRGGARGGGRVAGGRGRGSSGGRGIGHRVGGRGRGKS